MKQILAFGDSNTWGLIPGTGERYPEHIRWTGLLQKAVRPLGLRVLEDGVCGRTTVFRDPVRTGLRGIDSVSRHSAAKDLAAVILMLGTNDCKKVFHASPEEIGDGVEQCIAAFEELVPPDRILVISPLLLGEDVWKPDKDPAFDRQSVLTSRALREVYRAVAARRGNLFMAASDHAEASRADEEHLNAEGHERLAAAGGKKLKESVLF